jgi:TP901 family phage tail tape measure protein
MNASKAAAIIAIKADPKALEKALDASRKKLRAFGNSVKKIGGKIWGGGKSALGSIGAGIGISAGMGIAEQISSIRDFERNLVRLQIAAGKTPAEMNKIRDAMLEVSRATGVSREDILAGTQTYVDLTGDVEGATAAMTAFARISQASGSSVSDVATATAALKESMKLDPGDIEAAFSGLIQQGKAGAVSLKDFAGELASLAPQFAKFGGSGLLGIADLGAAFQIARKGFGSASEAATGLQNLMTALSRNADKFQKAGVKIFDKDPKTGQKRFRGFVDILDGISNSKLAKDPTLLTKAFGSVEAQQAFDMLRANREELQKIYTAGQDAGAVQRDLDTYMQSSAGRLDTAMNNLKTAIVEAFTPERIKVFVDMVQQVAEAIGKTIDGLGELKDRLTGDTEDKLNPFTPKGGAGDTSNVLGFLGGAWAQGAHEVVDSAAARGTIETMAKMPGKAGEAARIQLASESGFDQEFANIKGGATKNERIERAVRAQMGWGMNTMDSATEMGERGDLGRITAGQRYLEREGVSAQQAGEIYERMVAETMARELPKIAQAIRDGMKGAQVNLDNNKVKSAQDNAKSHRTGGG